jgi:flavin reductase (DIM6/NTAB) family NADH-FMN oxidoreductase RutF
MTKTLIEPVTQAYRLLNPGSCVIISVGDQEGDNLFAVTWNMPVRKDPPMMALVSGKRHHSYSFIARTGELAVNVMHAEHADAVYGAGTYKGAREEDKWAKVGLTREPATRIKAPLVAEAVASIECRVAQVVDLGASALVVSQILAAHVQPQHWSAQGFRWDSGLRLLHHLSGPAFTTSGEPLEASRP